MDNLLVSIIIPVYNGIKYIEKTLMTLLEQSYTHIEIILIDDGSTDDSLNYITKLSESDDRIIIIHKKNGGIASARNVGIKQARGEFIAFCDQDDLWHKQKLSKQIPLFSNEHVGLVYSKVLVENQTRKTLTHKDSSRFLKGKVFNKLIEENFISCISAVVRKKTIKEAGLFNEKKSLMGVDDWNLWLKIALITHVDYIPEYLCTRVFHDSNYSSNEEKMHQAELTCLEDIKEITDKKNISIDWSNVLYKVHVRYAKNYRYNGQFNNAGISYKQAYNIKASPLLLFLYVIYTKLPSFMLSSIQKIRRYLLSY